MKSVFHFLPPSIVAIGKYKTDQCTLVTHPGRTLNISAHCMLVSESPRRTQLRHALDGTMLIHVENRPYKISFTNGHWSPMASRSLLETNAGQFAYVGVHLKRHRTLPSEGRYSSGVGPGAIGCTCFQQRQKSIPLD